MVYMLRPVNQQAKREGSCMGMLTYSSMYAVDCGEQCVQNH